MFTSGSPNAGQLQIGIALVLQDRFSNQAREASSEIRRLHQEAKNVTNANLNAVQSLAGTGAAVGAGVGMALYGAVKQGAAFIDTMTFVDAIAKKNGVTMEGLTKYARSLGSETMFDSRDIASAMKFMAQAGLDTKEIYTNIRGAANLAGATGTSIGEKGGAADILTSVMKVFRMESSELNSNRVADILTKITTRSKTSLTDLAEGVTYAGTTVTNLGGSLEQTAAFLGILADAGMRGSMAGTAVSNAYRYLAKSIGDPKFKGHAALTSLGLGKQDFVDANGELLDMGESIKKIANASKGMNSVDRFNTLVSIFNVRGERAGTTMINNLDRYVQLLDELQNQSQGASSDIMAMRMGTIAGALDTMSSNLENLVSTFTEKVQPTLRPVFLMLGGIFDTASAILNIPYLGPLVSGFIVFATALITVRLGVMALTATLRLLFNDSTVSFANMAAVMTQGWRASTMSAQQYAAVQAGIIAAQRAGMTGNAAQNFAMSAGATMLHGNPGQYVGGVMYKNGRYYQQTATGGTVRIGAAAAAGIIGSKTPQELGVIGASATSLGIRGLGLGKGLLNAGKFGISLLGSPWTIGLMAVSFLLPRLITALTDNSDTHRENTSAVNTSSQIEIEKLNRANTLTSEEQNIMLARSIDNLTKAMSTGGPAATIVINVDGKETARKEVQRSNQEQVINVGAN